MNKINSYVGFAIKSRKVVYGADNIIKNNGCKLVIVSDALAQNTLQKLQTKNVKIITVPHTDYQTLNLRGLAVAITDNSLAQAIINNI